MHSYLLERLIPYLYIPGFTVQLFCHRRSLLGTSWLCDARRLSDCWGLLYGLGGGSLLCKSAVGRIDLEEVVQNNENHGDGAKEDGESVQIVVGNHGCGFDGAADSRVCIAAQGASKKKCEVSKSTRRNDAVGAVVEGVELMFKGQLELGTFQWDID